MKHIECTQYTSYPEGNDVTYTLWFPLHLMCPSSLLAIDLGLCFKIITESLDIENITASYRFVVSNSKQYNAANDCLSK
jgi:hypothetical protein